MKSLSLFLSQTFNYHLLSIQLTSGVNEEETVVVAVLAIIGGADSRLRLGGMVENEEHGKGVVTRITKEGKIYVQCTDEHVVRNSPLSLWKVVSFTFPLLLEV